MELKHFLFEYKTDESEIYSITEYLYGAIISVEIFYNGESRILYQDRPLFVEETDELNKLMKYLRNN